MLSVGQVTNNSKMRLKSSSPNSYSLKDEDSFNDLSQKLAHLAAILEYSNDSIISKDMNGIITNWNPASEKIYGYSKKEAIGRHITMLFLEENKGEFIQIMEKIKRGEIIKHFETVRVRKDGRKIHVLLSLSPIKDAHGNIVGASGIGRDISEQIELEKRKDDFISIASHELKTPLTTLKGFSQILIHYSDRLDPQIVGFIKRMNDQVDKLNILVSDLLDVSYLNSAKLKLRRQKFNIDELIAQIAQEMQQPTLQHQIILKLNAKCSIRADKYRLGQVLTNLISNAIKYSPQAREIILTSRSTSKFIEVSIEDFGIGLFSKDQQKIFEKFYQVKNKIRESFSGLGLGLYICAEIIRQHQGKIEVESKKGVGSTFRFQIPKS